MTFYRILVTLIASLFVACTAFANSSAVQNTTMPTNTTSAQTVIGKVSVNKASAQELMKVKGLNASKVRGILTYRKKNGGFKSLDELASVKGMKRMKEDEMKAIQAQLSL